MKLRENPSLQYILYLPTSGAQGAPIFITVHGISLNFQEHAQKFRPFAESQGVVMIAPYFDATNYDDYQRLGGSGSGRADLALKMIVKEVRELTNASSGKLYLFGYSGGAQFVHRYTMAYPDEVARLVVGAAGWYTFPDNTYEYPQGTLSPGLSGVTFAPDRYLRVPAAVAVGDQDVQLTSSLNQDPEINAQQGITRYERGQNWVSAMSAAARSRSLSTPYEFKRLYGCDHSFGRCMDQSKMGEATFSWLFGW